MKTIKIIVLLIGVMMLDSCVGNNHGVIDKKDYTNWYGGTMPPGICTYHTGDVTTEDSCNRYQIGDTIGHSSSHKQ